MGHLGKVSDDEFSVNVLSECKCEFRMESVERFVAENFLDPDCIPFFVRNLDPDKSESGDWCFDTDRFCLEREREVVLEIFDFREMDSFGRLETILYDGWADTFILHGNINPELKKSPLYNEGFFFDFFPCNAILVLDVIEEIGAWKIPCSEHA